MSEKTYSRRVSRVSAFKAAFSLSFHDVDCLNDEELLNYLSEFDQQDISSDEFTLELLHALYGHQTEIDALIEKHLVGWTLNRISRVNLVLLRLSVAEMLYTTEKKAAVAINEAVEISKIYGQENDYQFINGVLGTIARESALPTEE